jgi:hypothetical protein
VEYPRKEKLFAQATYILNDVHWNYIVEDVVINILKIMYG